MMQYQLMKIMLVDDSRTMRSIQKKTLLEIGFRTIVEAEDGSDALRKLENNAQIDLILLDWNMPNLSGLDLLKKIKAMPETKNIPVIMVTSEAHKEKVMEALNAGVADYLVKPFEQGALEKKVQKVLGVK